LDILVEFERPFGYFTLVRLGTYLEQTSVVESISSLEEP
jgi:predicted nucleotidyltransferase